MNKTILILITALFPGLASAAEFKSVTAICLAQGISGAGGNDAGEFISDSRLRLQVTKSGDGVEGTIKGVVMVASAWEELKSASELTPENAYIGLFNSEVLKANPNYRPRRYIGYHQFRDVDAKETAGRESGMWGEFVVAPEAFTSAEFKAVYIFQAGDHMGGSLIFKCTALN